MVAALAPQNDGEPEKDLDMKRFAVGLLWLSALAASTWAADSLTEVDIYKSPSCGCCGKWVEHMRTNGFKVNTHDTNNVAERKARLGVPLAMGSCHTAEVDGYLIEGHVPAGDVRRLLADKPRARGLLSPGMPASSPGMDDPRRIPYEILLLSNDGSTTLYAKH